MWIICKINYLNLHIFIFFTFLTFKILVLWTALYVLNFSLNLLERQY